MPLLISCVQEALFLGIAPRLEYLCPASRVLPSHHQPARLVRAAEVALLVLVQVPPVAAHHVLVALVLAALHDPVIRVVQAAQLGAATRVELHQIRDVRLRMALPVRGPDTAQMPASGVVRPGPPRPARERVPAGAGLLPRAIVRTGVVPAGLADALVVRVSVRMVRVQVVPVSVRMAIGLVVPVSVRMERVLVEVVRGRTPRRAIALVRTPPIVDVMIGQASAAARLIAVLRVGPAGVPMGAFAVGLKAGPVAERVVASAAIRVRPVSAERSGQRAPAPMIAAIVGRVWHLDEWPSLSPWQNSVPLRSRSVAGRARSVSRRLRRLGSVSSGSTTARCVKWQRPPQIELARRQLPLSGAGAGRPSCRQRLQRISADRPPTTAWTATASG